MKTFVLAACLAFATLTPSMGAASSDPHLGEIKMVGFNFCPRGWAETRGQLLAISDYSALFSLLGTTFGGDGRTTFALPDLQGRVAVGVGQGAGLRNYNDGQSGGTEETTVNVTLSHHGHEDAKTTVNVAGVQGEGFIPNVQPYVGIRHCIAIEGVFPYRP